MNRVTACFSEARKGGRKLLCPFLTAGYPSLDLTVELLLAAQEAGAGIVELGIPFSDPVADGPVIQASFTQALSQGTTVAKSLACVAAARRRGLVIPVMAMVSFSIIFKKGTREFGKMCMENGLDGVILPDVALEEAPAIVGALREAGGEGLKTTLLIAPTTAPSRRAAIAGLCDAFVYYLSVSGITGERKALPSDIAPNVAALRAVTQVPICVGFGISTAEQVREVTRVADGAIVGSAVIRKIGAGGDAVGGVRGFLTELTTGLTA